MIAKKKQIENKLTFSLVIGFFIIFVCIVFGKIFIRENEKLRGKIYPNVYIDSINVGYKTRNDVENLFLSQANKLKKVKLEVFYMNTPIATFSASRLHMSYNTNYIADQTMLIGRSSHLPSRILQQILTILNLNSYRFVRNIDYDKQTLKDFINEISDQYSYPAKNALFAFENDKVTNFRKEENGLQILEDDFQKEADKLINSLKNKTNNLSIIIQSRIIQPEITLAKSNTFGIEELIAEGKSNYTHSIPERIHNLTLASSKFNGVLIPNNKVFSFNEAVGDISSLTGYKPAYIIKAGKTVLGDGGGVCQVSTTLFRAALNAGLPITERSAHAYRVGYYENDSQPGFDATVYSPTADLKIKNDTNSYILIQTEIDKENNILTFRLYGKKDDRKVEISPATVYDVQPPPPPINQDDPTLKKGVVKQIDFAAWGAKSIFTYKVTYPNKKVEEKKFFSSYTPWHAVFLNGTAD